MADENAHSKVVYVITDVENNVEESIGDSFVTLTA